MYNSRGGDALRWDYPLIRFLERHEIPVTYSSDIDISNSKFIPDSVSHLVTTGPMRYWTKEFESSLLILFNLGVIMYIWVQKQAST